MITVGRKGEDIRLVDTAIDGFGQIMTIEHGGTRTKLRLPLVGEFQIENALVSAGLAIGTGTERRAFAALERLEGAKGRLELVGEKNGAAIFVDYAHKPDALKKSWIAMRPYAKRKLVVVFGAGGDRDAGKRPVMGEIAAQGRRQRHRHRRQSAQRKSGRHSRCDPGAAPGAREIGDRAEAIRTAVAELQPGDALVIAGKGHETGQIVGDKTLPFSDHDAARSRAGGACGMSAPLWTLQAMRDAMGAVRAARCPCDRRPVHRQPHDRPGEAYFAIKGDVHDGHRFRRSGDRGMARASQWSSRRRRDKFARRCRCWSCTMCSTGLRGLRWPRARD